METIDIKQPKIVLQAVVPIRNIAVILFIVYSVSFGWYT